MERIPVAVCDLEDSPLSRELIRAVADADQYNFRETLSNDAEAVKLLERGEVAAVLIIPQDFSEKFYRQESVELAFLQDGSNILQAGYAANFARARDFELATARQLDAKLFGVLHVRRNAHGSANRNVYSST